jgi:hypothetical protein
MAGNSNICRCSPENFQYFMGRRAYYWGKRPRLAKGKKHVILYWYFINSCINPALRSLDAERYVLYISGWQSAHFTSWVLDNKCAPYFRMTKCTFHKFGASGNIEKHDALCILPVNIGNTIMMLLFQDDKVHISQVRYLGQYWETWCTLHSATQYR